MEHFREVADKIKAEFDNRNQVSTGRPYYGDEAKMVGAAGGTCRPSLREEAEKSVGHHREQADKADRAAAFFRENPAFDEFIQLIRAGVIQV